MGGSSIRYAYETRFTPDIVGQFLATRSGAVKLFTWQEPQSPYPSDALRIHAADLRALVARAAAVDDPAAYGLYDLDHSSRVPLRVRSATGRQLELAPARPLRPGKYMYVATRQGMFGGRDFAYLTVVGPGRPVTPISGPNDDSAPQIADSLLPVAAALVSLLFVLLLGRSFLQRPAGQKALWAAGFACFAVATVCEAAGQRLGWSPALFRTYYVAGGVLTVGFLGAGSAWLLLPRRGRDALLGALASARSLRRSRSGSLPSTPTHLLRPRAGGRRTTPSSEGTPSSGPSPSTPSAPSPSSEARSTRSHAAAA